MIAPNNTLLKKQVVVMEDSQDISTSIKDVIEYEYEWTVQEVDTKEKAVSYAKNKSIAYYILDVNMGEGRKQEGIDALEGITKIDKDNRVLILSAHSENEILVKKIAKSNPNVFFIPKTHDIKDTIRQAMPDFLQTRLECLIAQGEEIKAQVEETREQLDKNYPKYCNLNIIIYEMLRKDLSYMGKYVAIIDGKLIGCVNSIEEGNRLLSELMSAYRYTGLSKFFAQVKRENDIIDEPSSLIIIDEPK